MRDFVVTVVGVAIGLPLMVLQNHVDIANGKIKRHPRLEWCPAPLYAVGLLVASCAAVMYRVGVWAVAGTYSWDDQEEFTIACTVTAIVGASILAVLFFVI